MNSWIAWAKSPLDGPNMAGCARGTAISGLGAESGAAWIDEIDDEASGTFATGCEGDAIAAAGKQRTIADADWWREAPNRQ